MPLSAELRLRRCEVSSKRSQCATLRAVLQSPTAFLGRGDAGTSSGSGLPGVPKAVARARPSQPPPELSVSQGLAWGPHPFLPSPPAPAPSPSSPDGPPFPPSLRARAQAHPLRGLPWDSSPSAGDPQNGGELSPTHFRSPSRRQAVAPGPILAPSRGAPDLLPCVLSQLPASGAWHSHVKTYISGSALPCPIAGVACGGRKSGLPCWVLCRVWAVRSITALIIAAPLSWRY